MSKKDIAIIGLSGAFAGSNDLRIFWENLKEGKELIHFYSDEELLEKGVEQALIDTPNYVKAASRMEEANYFDYSFFGYTKEEALLMDPQTRLLHQHVWGALEDSGYIPDKIKDKVGLFLAASDNLNWRAHALINRQENIGDFFTQQLSSKEFASTLISYKLDLKGPSYYLDTACSSSLVAIHLACRNLLMKECAVAVAGGCRVDSYDYYGYHHSEGMIHSADGHCKTFDAGSTGTIVGEGIGTVVLKKMEDALADGDHIYAVIKASATNNDGKRKIGYTAPSVKGQTDCIRLAHRIGQIDPATISYVEAHGTGTKLGDPVEIEALNAAFNVKENQRCAIGSVKSNIGHLDTAAGVAGVIKTALSLKHKVIPPSINFNEPNPEINFQNGPFYVNTEAKEWEATSDLPIRAGVSSLGIGGTNAHIVLEEAPKTVSEAALDNYYILPFSAKNKESLKGYKAKLEYYLKQNAESHLDIAYTLKNHRKNFSQRDFLITNGKAVVDVQEVLQSNMKGDNKGTKDKVFLCSGSGTQYLNMGRDLYQSEPFFKDLVDQGIKFLQLLTNKDCYKILFSDDTEHDLINQNQYTQPLLFIVEYAMAKWLEQWGIKPDYLIGHSTGEYVAAAVSGIFSFEAGVKLVQARALLMNKAPKGSMLAVNLGEHEVRQYLTGKLELAAVNSPNYCVVSGDSGEINGLANVLEQKEIRCTPLRVSLAGHSYLMNTILEEFEQVLQQVQLNLPQIPIISNYTGKELTHAEALSTKYWTDHLRNTVRFAQGINTFLTKINPVFIEIGPGYGLSTFVKQIAKETDQNLPVINTFRHPQEEVNDELYLMTALAAIWREGIDVDWTINQRKLKGKKVSIPTYSFLKNELPTRVNPFQDIANDFSLSVIRNEIENCVYSEEWKSINCGITTKESNKVDWTIWIGGDQFREVMEQLKLETGKWIQISAGTSYQVNGTNSFTLDFTKEIDFEKVKDELQNEIGDLGKGRIIYAAGINPTINQGQHNLENELIYNYNGVLNLGKHILANLSYTHVQVTYLVNNLFDVYGNETIVPERALGFSAMRVLPKDIINLSGKVIEWDAEAEQTDDIFTQQLTNVILDDFEHDLIAIRGKKYWTNVYTERDAGTLGNEENIVAGGVYVITGGLGAMANEIQRFLLAQNDCRIILVGRSGLQGEKRAKIEENDRIRYVQNDLSSEEGLIQAIKEQLDGWTNEITGVYHTAGVIDEAGLISERPLDASTAVFLPKVQGSKHICTAASFFNAKFVVLCSSISAVTSPLGQVAYVAANTYQNVLANSINGKVKVKSIQWDIWKESGLAVKSAQLSNTTSWESELERGISNDEGRALFEKLTNSAGKNFVTSMLPINEVIEASKGYTMTNILSNTGDIESDQHRINRPELDVEFIAPGSEVEERLAKIWQDLLNVDHIGIKDNFFELGGDSLKAMVMLNNSKKEYQYELALKDFFKSPTIESLSAEIEMASHIKKMQTKGQTKNVITI